MIVLAIALFLAAGVPRGLVQATTEAQTDTEDDVLSGRVVDPEGAPVPSARVLLWTRVPRESALRGSAATGADGRFRIRVEELPQDGYSRVSFLEVEATGFALSHLEHVYVPAPSYDVGPIVVFPPVELRGRVTRADGTPIAGAEIHAALGAVRAPHGDHARRPPIAVSDASGEYTCRALPPGLVTLGAGAPGFADGTLGPRELRRAQPNHADFVLAPERSRRFQVTASDGSPLPDACAEPIDELGGEPWSVQAHYRAFWRTAEPADPEGWITLAGLDESFSGDVRVSAPGHRAELVSLGSDPGFVRLQPVTWIELVAASRDGGPAPELYQVIVRDGTRSPSWCGNCDDSRLAKLWADSPAVQVLAPERWRIAWNGPGCFVDGGRPSSLSAVTRDDLRASAELEEAAVTGARLECRLEFDTPARLEGSARTPSGEPVALRLGVQLSLYRSDWLSTTSDAQGRFVFERIGAGPQWLYSLDDRWQVDEASDRVELVPGRALTGLVVTVHPQPDGRTGRVRGRLRLAGKAPGEPVLLALDEVPNQHLPDAYPRGFAWTDPEGNFEIRSFWPRSYHILPKHHPAPPGGGWRDFAREFPAHDARWSWTVDVPASGVAEVEIDMPPESEWDRVAPPRPRDR